MKINGVEFDSISIGEGTSTDISSFEIISSQSSKHGVTPIQTGFGNYSAYTSSHNFNWQTTNKKEKQGSNIKGVSTQIRNNLMVYTFIKEIPSNNKKEWEFSSRIIGVINLTNGNRAEYILDKDEHSLKGKYADFKYENQCSTGIIGSSEIEI